MDLTCSVCAEPVDNDSIHEEAEHSGQTYLQVLRDFQRNGCSAVGFKDCEATGDVRADMASAMYELLGDDADGAAAMLADYGL